VKAQSGKKTHTTAGGVVHRPGETDRGRDRLL